jgi:hypothetical protein
MDGQIQLISTPRLPAPLKNYCIAFAIAAAGVIVCYFWLDQPLAHFYIETLRIGLSSSGCSGSLSPFLCCRR